MSDPALGVLNAIDAALRASTALATAMGGTVKVYSAPPANAALPYVLIGQDQITGDDDECADASEIFAEIHLWSRAEPPGPHGSASQARTMGAAVRAALKTELAIAGHDTDEWVFEGARYGTDPDGSTHGILNFKYLVTASA